MKWIRCIIVVSYFTTLVDHCYQWKWGFLYAIYLLSCEWDTWYSRLSLIGTPLIGTICLSEPILKSHNRIFIQIYARTTVNRNPRFIGIKLTGPEGFRLTRGYCIMFDSTLPSHCRFDPSWYLLDLITDSIYILFV